MGKNIKINFKNCTYKNKTEVVISFDTEDGTVDIMSCKKCKDEYLKDLLKFKHVLSGKIEKVEK